MQCASSQDGSGGPFNLRNIVYARWAGLFYWIGSASVRLYVIGLTHLTVIRLGGGDVGDWLDSSWLSVVLQTVEMDGQRPGPVVGPNEEGGPGPEPYRPNTGTRGAAVRVLKVGVCHCR